MPRSQCLMIRLAYDWSQNDIRTSHCDVLISFCDQLQNEPQRLFEKNIAKVISSECFSLDRCMVGHLQSDERISQMTQISSKRLYARARTRRHSTHRIRVIGFIIALTYTYSPCLSNGRVKNDRNDCEIVKKKITVRLQSLGSQGAARKHLLLRWMRRNE